MAKEEEMTMEEKMDKAMETWDGTWKSILTCEDVMNEEYKFLGWYNTEEEAINQLLEIADKAKKAHPNDWIKVMCNNTFLCIDINQSESEFKRYYLRVSERRSCFENL